MNRESKQLIDAVEKMLAHAPDPAPLQAMLHDAETCVATLFVKQGDEWVEVGKIRGNPRLLGHVGPEDT